MTKNNNQGKTKTSTMSTRHDDDDDDVGRSKQPRTSGRGRGGRGRGSGRRNQNHNNHKTSSAGGGGQENNNNNNKRLKKMSHTLSWALRHQAENIGLSIRPDGYVPVEEFLTSNHPKFIHTFACNGTSGDKEDVINDIRTVVSTNDKQRFKLAYRPRSLYYGTKTGGGGGGAKNNNDNNDDDNGENASMILCIRANQGHSMKCIDPDLLLTKLTSEEILRLPCIVHGTYQEAWYQHIQHIGLNKMGRNHIHFATGIPKNNGGGGGTGGVISGMRTTCNIRIYLDQRKCAAAIDQLDLYMSDNGVVLTDGINGTGTLPPTFFSHVTNAQGKILLDNRRS